MSVKSESEVAQSCPTLCDPRDGSPSGSPVPGILRQEHWSGLLRELYRSKLNILKVPKVCKWLILSFRDHFFFTFYRIFPMISHNNLHLNLQPHPLLCYRPEFSTQSDGSEVITFLIAMWTSIQIHYQNFSIVLGSLAQLDFWYRHSVSLHHHLIPWKLLASELITGLPASTFKYIYWLQSDYSS